jgi:hypothetical protein
MTRAKPMVRLPWWWATACLLIGMLLPGRATATRSPGGVPDDREQIAGLLQEWKEAFLAENVDAFMTLYSEHFNFDAAYAMTHSGVDGPALKRFGQAEEWLRDARSADQRQDSALIAEDRGDLIHDPADRAVP